MGKRKPKQKEKRCDGSKVTYSYRKDAMDAAAKLRVTTKHAGQYECSDCGGWHVYTKMKKKGIKVV